MNNHDEYLEILFAGKLHPDDVVITTQATRDKPGVARLANARIGDHRPDAPNSRPIYSCAGGLLGFVASVKFIQAPFADTYLLEEPNGRQQR